AKVLQNRSVEMAKKLCVNLVCRSSFNDNEGTLITKEENIMEKPLVNGIALMKDQARVSLSGVVDRPGIASDIFKDLATAEVNIDMIVQTIGHDGRTNLDFTVSKDELKDAETILAKFIKNKEIEDVTTDDSIAKVSVVGVGMKSHSGVASKAFETMANENINIMMISTSEIKVSMVIAQKYSELAVQSLHEAYELDK
ncbi:MAG: ACT domain-containing protein, partial [Thiovulaceae bacterium]|nr:ACT domain-containing protein [Sulfurimonadaceae bacterium]